MKEQTSYACPVCRVNMVSHEGQVLDIRDGMTVWCDNKECRAQEVSGHGRNIKEAYEVILDKFKVVR
jgi:hypothetical protein